MPWKENGVKCFKEHFKECKHYKPKTRSFGDEIITIFIFACGVSVTVPSVFCSWKK